MVRLGLVTYLVLATLAGPWLCCCTATHLGGRLNALPGRAETSPAASRCCGHHAGGHQHQEHRKKAPQERHSPDCPCRQDSSQAVALAESESVKQLQARQFCDDLERTLILPGAEACLDLGKVAQRPEDGQVLPFLTAQDVLFGLHILRC